MHFDMTEEAKLTVVLAISAVFFLAELAVGFKTHSLALVADAFHYLNDLISYIVALAAIKVEKRKDYPKKYTYGWQRSKLLGAFFNGVFLLALGISVFLQSIERFVSLQRVEKPMLMLILGAIGLVLNVGSILILKDVDRPCGHDHTHKHEVHESHTHSTHETTTSDLSPNLHQGHHHNKFQPPSSHDSAMVSILKHVIADAINNIGVMLAALIIWQTKYDGRYYADPGVGIGISIMILYLAYGIIKETYPNLLQSTPEGVDISNVKADLESINGISSIHELHVWGLSQHVNVATVHILTKANDLAAFSEQAKIIQECLHGYDIHSSTLQPEFDQSMLVEVKGESSLVKVSIGNESESSVCQIGCRESCDSSKCCSGLSTNDGAEGRKKEVMQGLISIA